LRRSIIHSPFATSTYLLQIQLDVYLSPATSLFTQPTDADRSTSTSPPAIMSTNAIIKKPSFGTTSEQFTKAFNEIAKTYNAANQNDEQSLNKLHREKFPRPPRLEPAIPKLLHHQDLAVRVYRLFQQCEKSLILY
jgi:hypothetical protein